MSASWIEVRSYGFKAPLFVSRCYSSFVFCLWNLMQLNLIFHAATELWYHFCMYSVWNLMQLNLIFHIATELWYHFFKINHWSLACMEIILDNTSKKEVEEISRLAQKGQKGCLRKSVWLARVTDYYYLRLLSFLYQSMECGTYWLVDNSLGCISYS